MKKTLSNKQHSTLIDNPWQELRKFTDARIGLGRAGISQPTRAQLAFQLDHASARDAVHIALDVEQLRTQLQTQALPPELEILPLHSRAPDRVTYLQRPDLGRRLDQAAIEQLQDYRQRQPANEGQPRAVIVIADGLSSTATQSHAATMVGHLHKALTAEAIGLHALCIVEQGRVAVGDEVGELLGAKLLILLVGERPGLSSPDSLGIYYTYQPKLGYTDAQRNCLSNIRPAGMSFTEATDKLMWLIRESRKRQLSGVQLKDESDTSLLDAGEQASNKNFLLD